MLCFTAAVEEVSDFMLFMVHGGLQFIPSSVASLLHGNRTWSASGWFGRGHGAIPRVKLEGSGLMGALDCLALPLPERRE